MPYEQDLRRAAEVLNAGKKVAILVGAGALHATDEVIAVAEKLGAGVAKALLGKAALPDDLPWVTGSIGLLGTKPSWELMTDCDTLLMIGSGFPYSEFLPKEGQARGVQIDIKPDMLSLRYPMEVNLVGDAAETLRALLPLLEAEDRRRPGARRSRANVREWWKTLEERAMAGANPVNPQRVAWELSPRLPERAIITRDSGSCANWYARDLKIRRGMMCSLSGGLASMGAAVPYAIAAKFAHPDRPVIALVGDGAMQMNNMAELITVAKYWRALGQPDLDRLRVQQRGSQPGHLGAAGHGGRSEIQRLAADPERALSQVRRADRARRASMSTIPSESARPGTRRSRPTGRWCWRSRPIPKCRRCRRTSRFEQAQELHLDADQGRSARRAPHRRHGAPGAELGPAGEGQDE